MIKITEDERDRIIDALEFQAMQFERFSERRVSPGLRGEYQKIMRENNRLIGKLVERSHIGADQ